MTRFNDGRDWFHEKRFGLFIHWGLYSQNGWHEQEQYRKILPRKKYTSLIDSFNPVDFDPDEWLDMAEETGMKYLCFTTKHIDGFCMWDTKKTSYNIMNTPYQKDILAMIAEACHKRDFPLCLYYSVSDMNCRCFPTNGRSYELPAPEDGDDPDVNKYLEFVRAQIRELCSNYGKIHGFWWDANLLEVKDASFNELIRTLQPEIIINNRGFDSGDFPTAERNYEEYSDITNQRIYEQPTEACESIGRESWGYRRNEDYFSIGYLTRSIDRHLAKGGNFLLNVGPKPNGEFPQEAIDIIKAAGVWYKRVGEAFDIPGATHFFQDNPDLLVIGTGRIFYVHFTAPLECSGIVLKPINLLPRRATILNNGVEVNTAVELMPSLHKDSTPYLHIWGIPVDDLTNEALVIKLEFDKPLEVLQTTDL